MTSRRKCIAEFDTSALITVFYTNWRGEKSVRTLNILEMYWGSTKWHPEPQWLLRALDIDQDKIKDFALKDMIPVSQRST